MIPNNNKNKNNNAKSKCPKCSSDMVQHLSLLSMPLTSSSSSLQQNAEEETEKMNIEDQDANFIFKFISCVKCGYSEFFLNNVGRRI